MNVVPGIEQAELAAPRCASDRSGYGRGRSMARGKARRLGSGALGVGIHGCSPPPGYREQLAFVSPKILQDVEFSNIFVLS